MNLFILKLPYIVSFAIFFIGLYIVIVDQNNLKKLLGLSILQSSILILYVSLGKIRNGIIPVYACNNNNECEIIYSNPLPHVLMLTAIVVGLATLAVGLALLIKIKARFGSINDNELDKK
ncbi:MAG: cation:proton antiporter subunit C [Sphingobacteriia bacterium]|nr:cation:proton antiporter subunit C [Sphingobacteriia bacterium]